jgi:hypothetical protein
MRILSGALLYLLLLILSNQFETFSLVMVEIVGKVVSIKVVGVVAHLRENLRLVFRDLREKIQETLLEVAEWVQTEVGE